MINFEERLRLELEALIDSIVKELDISVPGDEKEEIIDRTLQSIAAFTVAGYSQTLAKQFVSAKEVAEKLQDNNSLESLPDIAND